MTGNKFIIDSITEPAATQTQMGSPKCVKFVQTQKEIARPPAQDSVLERSADREAVFSLRFKVPEAMNSKENE